MVFFIFVLCPIFLLAIVIYTLYDNTKNAKQRKEIVKTLEIERKKRTEENEPKKEAYFKWLNENYTPSKIIEFPSYDFYRKTWERYESEIVAVDENKEVVIFSRKEIAFKNIIHCELITKTSQTSITNTTTAKNNGIGRAVVGGIIAGGAGAIVGANTASSNSFSNTTTNTNTEIAGVKIYIADISAPEIIYYSSSIGKNAVENRYSTMLAIIAISKK